MDLFITTTHDFDARLTREQMNKTYTVTPEKVNEILAENGYTYFERGLYSFEGGTDEHILFRCSPEHFTEINAILWNLSLDEYKLHFDDFSYGVTKYTFQNYEQGQTAPRLIYLNDITEY